MIAQGRPKPKRAVIYNEDDLYDFDKNGGSVSALLDQEIKEGNRFIIMRQPNDGPAAVVMMLETPDDISRWDKYREKMRDCQEKVLGNPPPAKNGESPVTSPVAPSAQGIPQKPRGSSRNKAP